MTDNQALIALAEADEEMEVSQREHPNVHPDLLRSAIALACERGGGTTPVSEYDIRHARDLAEGEKSENARLRSELRRARAEIVQLRARASL